MQYCWPAVAGRKRRRVRALYRAFFVAAATEHPKAQQKSVSADDLQDEEVLLLEDGHCLRDQALAVVMLIAVSKALASQLPV